MRDRKRGGSIRRWLGTGEASAGRRRARRPGLEGLEARQLLVASLEPIANLTVPADLGRVVRLDGGADDQAFTASSDNPDVRVSVINGPFLSIDVSHASSGAGDPAFSGTLTFQLFEELTPITARRIQALVNQGFYTSPTTNPDPNFTNLPSKNFHRIASGFPGDQFIVQGGSANGNGTGDINQPGFPFADEFRAPLVFTGEGQLAMANAGDDTNESQFFVTTGSPRFLDFQHTIFGQLVDGFGVLSQMTQVSRNNVDAPVSPILITGTRVAQASPDGSLLIDTTSATAGESATVTVTAADGGSTDVETFQVSVVANTENQRPFLGPVEDQLTRPGQAAQFQLSAVSTNPGDQLTYAVGGGVASDGTFAPVQNATATVDASGRVTVTPNSGFEGTIELLVGVRDQVNRAGSLDAVANFDTKKLSLAVTTNNRPTATAVTVETDQNQAVTVQLAGQTGDPDSGQTLVFELTGPPVNGSIAGFNAQTGTLRYTPNTNFSGDDVFTYRVRDVGAPTPNLASAETTATVRVAEGEMINTPPTAQGQQLTVQVNTPQPVQLIGMTGDPETGQTLTYILDKSMTRGTVTDFDADTGTLLYTPPRNFVGADTLSFRVRDVGPPGPNLESEPATVSFNVIGAVNTGAVRQVGTVVMVTPPPGRLLNPTPNTIEVGMVDGRVSVTVNGQIDQFRPLISELERVVVYGTKANDTITISPDLPLLTTLDGGLGGVNRLQSNDLPSRLHGWFGRNTLRGGAARDELIGRMGRVRFLPSPGNDLAFAGDPNRFPQRGSHSDQGQGEPPTGQFFRFVNDRLVPVDTPSPRASGRVILHPPRANLAVPDFNLPGDSAAPGGTAAQQLREARAQLRQQRLDRS
ncbi:peptidylprolyl isomerase [Tautonia plasticadhaerens]|uniref:peptidylprolyl isomerase n=1 Tax=Tautonia plasticadhaerens TaxID=2527974 RepID=A0A518H5A9_9BACT|nr:peptidylprolyl isomerase [Tautonia plasticadhaerens]QDV36012.1 Peptidyl-prolyl cis-trans isomerase B [Tautonia plasticadhaerens]